MRGKPGKSGQLRSHSIRLPLPNTAAKAFVGPVCHQFATQVRKGRLSLDSRGWPFYTGRQEACARA